MRARSDTRCASGNACPIASNDKEVSVICRIFMAAFFGFLAFAQAGNNGHAADDLAALTYQAAGDELRTRVVINFDHEPEVSTMLLGEPHRLAIDLPKTVFAFDKKSIELRGLITDVRYGMIDDSRSRLIFTIKGPFVVERLDVIKNDNSPGYRLVADLVASSDQKFADALKAQNQTTASTVVAPKGDRIASAAANEVSKGPKPFTVVVDPGHGGIDSGAESGSGSLEKNVTLMFAQQLRDELGKLPGIRSRNDSQRRHIPAVVGACANCPAVRGRSVHFDTCRYDQSGQHSRCYGLHSVRQGFRCRVAGHGGSRESSRRGGRYHFRQ